MKNDDKQGTWGLIAIIVLFTIFAIGMSGCGGGDNMGETSHPQQLRLSEAPIDFTTATGWGVYIAVIDTGVRTTHRDFVGHVGPTYVFFSSVAQSQEQYGDCAPYGGHGTGVASVAAGVTWGVAPDAMVYPLIAVNCVGWVDAPAVVAAIDAVIASPLRPAVINLSIGGDAEPLIDEAVTRAVAAGIVVVAAAGNEAKDACLSTPARVPEAITIGARNADGTIASFSNFGECVDMYLPGVDVMVASSIADNGIGVGTGTSYAAPYAAGWAARVLERLPNATPAEVFGHLINLYQGDSQ